MDPTSSWLLPRSTAIGWLNEEDTISSKHLWWGPFTSTFCEHCCDHDARDCFHAHQYCNVALTGAVSSRGNTVRGKTTAATVMKPSLSLRYHSVDARENSAEYRDRSHGKCESFKFFSQFWPLWNTRVVVVSILKVYL